MSRGWGYAIDYAAAIREDEARVAHLSSHLCIRVARELLPEAQKAYPAHSSWSAYQLVTHSADGLAARAAIFSLTLEDVRAWALFYDEDREAIWDVLGIDQRGDFTRGKDVAARFEPFDVYSETDRVKALSKARASLARHKRNSERHEGRRASS